MTTSAAVMKIVKRTDKNTRALAKVVSAIEWIRDENVETPFVQEVTQAVEVLEDVKFKIIQERRNLRVALWKEVDKQQ